jgi:hypothetical protein
VIQSATVYHFFVYRRLRIGGWIFCGFGDTEKCGYLYSGNIPIKYSDYEQVISIGICDYLSAVFLWENE